MTLVRLEGARCGGVAYAIDATEREAILAALDKREQGGYERVELDIEVIPRPLASEPDGAPSPATPGGVETLRAVTWVATAGNPYHLGPAPLSQLLAEVRGSVGPSGTNLDYVLRLAEALREHDIADGDIFDIAAALAVQDPPPP